MFLEDVPRERVVVDADKAFEAQGYSGKRCDFILFVLEYGRKLVAAPVELKSGSVDVSDALEQLQEGAAFAERLVEQKNDPRYAVWLKSEPARLADPDSAEHQVLFTATLPGALLANAVLCHRAIRTLVLDYKQKAPARSQERLIYRHGIHAITEVMMKRLRNKIGATAVIDPAAISALLSQSLDQIRQKAFDLGQQRLILEEPLVYFRNQGNVGPSWPI